MQRYVKNIVNFFELFEKLKFEMEKYGSIYTAIIFELKDKSRLNEFSDFLLKYLRISDTVFSYRDWKLIVILEETTLRWALILNENLRERIENKWFHYDYFCAAIQGDFIDSDEKLLKSLKKRLDIAIETNSTDCIYNLDNG